MDSLEASPIAGILVEGAECLAVDTGLTPAAFAQAKLARYVVESAALVDPSLRIEERRAEGVVERDGRMLVRFPPFSGERLDLLVARCPSGGALGEAGARAVAALGRWMAALSRLRSLTEAAVGRASDLPLPAAAIAADDGSMLFLPAVLALRAMEGRGSEARFDGVDKWIQPDLSGEAGDAFTAAALAYRILCGVDPFGGKDADAVRADMRDGCVLPASLVRPDLDEEIADLLDACLVPAETAAAGNRVPRRTLAARPSLARISEGFAAAEARGFYRELSPSAHEAARAAKDKFSRTRGDTVRTRRFMRRNSTVIAVIAISVLGVALFTASMIRDRAGRPTTKGMVPIEVVRTYYDAFGKFDHEMMAACVTGKAGKNDIDAATNLFVISRVRQAYENKDAYISAGEWIAAGSPVFDGSVFGVDALRVDSVDDDPSDGAVSFTARYDLWRPGEQPDRSGAANATAPAAPAPVRERREDSLVLSLRSGAWRISSMERKLLE